MKVQGIDNINNIKSLDNFIELGLLSEDMLNYLLREDILNSPLLIISENNKLGICILNKFIYYYSLKLKTLYSNKLVYLSEEIDFSISNNNFKQINIINSISSDVKVGYMTFEKLSVTEHNNRNIANLVYMKLYNINIFGSYIGLTSKMLDDTIKYLISKNKVYTDINFHVLDFKSVNTKTMAVELANYKFENKGFNKKLINKFSLEDVCNNVWVGNYV